MESDSPLDSPKRRAGPTWSLVGLIVILAAILVLPDIVSQLGRTRCRMEGAHIRALAGAVSEYAADHGGLFPRSLEELLVSGSRGSGYIDCDHVPLDPWGRPYGYEPPSTGSTRFRVFTLGADGEPGGEGDERDIDNLLLADGRL